MKELLVKAASLCREAAEKLRNGETPEKQASEIADTLAKKGFLNSGEKERYAFHLMANPEKIAGAKDYVASLPARENAIGELSSEPVEKQARDAMDSFIYG